MARVLRTLPIGLPSWTSPVRPRSPALRKGRDLSRLSSRPRGRRGRQTENEPFALVLECRPARPSRVRSALAVLAVSTGVPVQAEVVMAQSKVETEARNKTAVQASFDAWKAGAGSPFDLLADDATSTIVGRSDSSRTYGSREDFMRDVIRPFNARMRVGLKPTIRNI